MNKNTFFDYRKLIAKVDAFSNHIRKKHGEQIVCRHGCTDCCSHDLQVMPVEFFYLKQGLELQPEVAGLIKDAFGAETSCILLSRGGCLLYEARPVICRTHGLPLLITEAEGQYRDCCPKNFSKQSIEGLPPEDLLHLERLNTMLVSVNIVFASHEGLNPASRLSVSGLSE